MAKLFYQGHGSFRIISNDGVVVYVDPYLGEGYDMPADLVLISHEHHDHTKTELITLRPDAVILRGSALTDGIRYDGYEGKGIKVSTVPAYNKNHAREECVGFIIEVDGVKVYATGDTSKTDYMPKLKKEKIDYALYCCDGIYNMDAKQASKCAKIVKAKVDIPYHSYPENLYSESITSQFKSKGKVILLPSQEILLEKKQKKK